MNKTSSQTTGNMGFLFSLLLFLLFVLCSVFTILIGSRVYQNIRARNDRSFYSGTALAYITNKVRQSDGRGKVEVRTEDGLPVLVLKSQYGDVVYETWIYTRNGSLMELFSAKDSGLTTADGLPIMDCSYADFTLEPTGSPPLLTITLGKGSDRTCARLCLRSSQDGGGGYE